MSIGILARMNDVLPGPGRTRAERQSGRRYIVEFSSAVALFVLCVVLGDRAAIQDTKVHLAVGVVLPTAAVLGMAIAATRFVARMDERQRLVMLASAAVAGVATAVVTVALGLLQENRLIRLDLTVVLPIFVLFFGISLALVRRRYE
jgi:hypothetical protein